MDAVQVWPQLLQIAGDIVAKAQDWPGADDLAERLKKTIPQQFLDPEDRQGPDPQVQQLEMAMQALIQENQSLKVDKEIDLKKLIIDVYNAETQRIRALSDNMVDGNDIELKAIQAIVDGGSKISKADIEADAHEHSKQMAERQQAAAEQNQQFTQENTPPPQPAGE